MSNEKELLKPYEVKAHSHQIADTGDYDGCWEITNGKISIFTKDDPEDERLQKIADTLNESECDFYLDDSDAFLRHHFESENKKLNTQLSALEQTIVDQDKVILEQRKEIERLEADKSNYLKQYAEVLDQNEKIAQRAKDLEAQNKSLQRVVDLARGFKDKAENNAAKNQWAANSLDSEKDMNAKLTEEIEQLTAQVAQLKAELHTYKQ
jgi:DNA repair exonuclease SbcCD ATPase subunit